MKLTKKLEAEVLKAYTTVWDAYLKGDMKIFASILDENCHIIGSAAGEIFKNKKSAVKYYKATAEQISGKVEFRSRKISVLLVDNGIMVNEQSDFYLLIDDQWTFYGHARISSLFHKKSNKWKIIHQHGSFPDSKTEEGEQVNADKIKAENIQLRGAVKRRTEELENKNRELEIETALEKVRAVAMGIKEPADMLNVCRMISDQLLQLGFKEIRNVQTVIIYPEKYEYLNYQYFTPYDKDSIEIIDYRLHPDVLAFTDQMLASADAYYTKTFEGDELKVWREYRKQTNQLPDPKLDATTSSHYYFYSIGSGALGVTTYAPLSEVQIVLFKRFRNVFELAYRRFIDIEKALAQAKEVKIELGLERVRARAMAMQHSEELADLVATVFKELTQLDFTLTSCIIWIHDHEHATNTLWIASAELNKPAQPFLVNSFYIDFFKSISHAWKAKDPKWIYTLTGTEKKKFEKAFFKELPDLPNSLKNALKNPKQVVFSASFNNFGALEIVETEQLTDEKFDILHRFGKVFNASYTRFNDLKKAEAQAREAQIEAALERVRSQSMAMHSSNDLLQVVSVLKEQLLQLGFNLDTVSFLTDFNESGYNMWLSSPGEKVLSKIYVPRVDYRGTQLFKEALEKNWDFISYVLTKEEKDIYFKNFLENTVLRNAPQEAKQQVYDAPGLATSLVLLKSIVLTVGNFKAIAFTDDENKIIKRFGYVFEQSYTRFLDLQKAEGQAKEAQIENALERVRSRTMAMQKSEELKEVIRVVYEQFVQLNILVEHAGFIMDYKARDDMYIWLADKQEVPFQVTIPYFDCAHWNSFNEAKQKGTNFFANKVDFEEKNKFYQELFKLFPIPNEAKEFYFNCPGVAISTVLLENVGLYIENFSGIPYTDEENNTLMRFGKVFQQTYTRFLDLQKAEAQARESQIQLALERVRARTMAMQRSDELPQAATLLFQQIQSLGIQPFSTGYNIWDENKKIVTSSMSSGGIIQPSFRLPLTEEASLIECYEAGQRGDIFFVQELGGAKLRSHLNYMSTLPVIGELMKKIAEAGLPLPEYMINHHAFFSHGYLLFITYAPVPEAHEIFKRFAKVFEQTYTRFLDLQKAEAQAKEAQTEVALERIRARAMAMHSSNELMDVAHILREQMGLLDQPDLETSVVNLFDEDSDYIHSWHAFREPGSSSGRTINGTVSFRKDSSTLTREMLGLYHSGKKEYTLEATGEKLNEFIQVLVNAQPDISNYIGKHPPEKVYYHFATFTGGALLTVSYQPTTEDIKLLQRRAASVFDMAYRRYCDLKKAEAQTREAQIEIAVERVRAKALAMHKSEEILSVVVVLRNELLGLNIPGVSGTTIYLKQDDGRIRMWDLTSVIELEDGFHLSMDIVFPLEETHPELFIRKIWNATEKYSVQMQNRDDLMRTVEWLGEYKKEEAENVRQFIETIDLQNLFHSTVPLANGKLSVDMMEAPPAEMEPILQKMATAFDLAYKRFLDLQKAEAQAREAQIEVALERVRSRTMAMHKSDELRETAQLLYHEFGKLGIKTFTCGYMFIEEEKNTQTGWFVLPDGTLIPNFIVFPLTGDHVLDKRYNDWKEKKPIHVFEIQGEVNKEHHHFLSKHVPAWVAKDIFSQVPDRIIFHCANFSYGYLLILATEFLSEEDQQTTVRFAKVFDLTYRRFLDLQKAEAQTRESQIELGLERVRARAMAMQNSDELKELIGTVNTELTKLDLILDRCFILIYDIKSMGVTWWMSNPEAPLKPIGLFVKYHEQPPYLAFIKGWKERNLKWQYVLEGEVKKTWDKFLFVETELSQLPDFVIANMKANNRVFLNASFNSFGCLTLATLEPLPDEHFDIMLRFAKVFDLTYTRFNDLKQAEGQAKEAKTEAALERVRAKAMAMHKSEDLNPAVATVFEELGKLNIGILRCGIAIMDKEKPRGDVWITVKSEQGNTIQVSGDESLDYHPLLIGAYDGWLKQEDFSYVLQGEDLLSYYHDVASMKYQLPVSSPFDKEKIDQQQFYFNAVFQDGSLFAFMETAITDEAKSVIKRFANVFNLTYKRFLDLQKAEAQTREAKIETALERVRARALAMQEPEELKDVAQVLRTEMGLLGVEELETCSIYINDEATNKTECWYALKDHREEEKRLVSDHFPLNLDDTWVGREMKNFYGSDAKQVSIIMQGANRKEWINYCEEKSVPFRGYYGEVIPDRTYHLYKFSHGAVGAAAAGDISAESWKLLSRAASVFSLAYSRFKDLTQARIDLKKLKEEKQRAETALTELKSTQTQLIQSEKMASLGELTAGIAHEIQNPLNFVNNFSEVSNELIEEMKDELSKGNNADALQLAEDVKQNLEKINHHGKRADAIVKGMLQHSRTSAGQKEPTDINALADEYLRLAFHGLRAKDKSFNAKFETDFDESIDKVNIMPQDIGRVVLNLINNAFYAVTERKKRETNGYEPTVTVITKKENDTVQITVKDNGIGISQKILDKIFQPFFTTKPTGQGTGLGLSLAYDIVTKAHGGELKVETKEGEGSEFVIQLPAT